MPSALLTGASGLAIAAACGLRAFLPLLVIGMSARVGLIPVHESVAWLAHTPVLWALGIATAVEIIGDKVPAVDHVLDAVGVVLRPAAGALAAYAAIADWPEPLPVVLALVAGTGALGVQALKAKTRVGSTLLTAGIGNPVLSIAEDIGAFGLSALALLVPLLALVFVIAGVFAARGVARALSSRRASQR